MNMALNKETVLIVDDEPQMLTALTDVLEDEFNVLTANSPNDAIDLLSRNGNDLSVIISDQRMPGMNGHEFLSRAKDISNASRLMITGFSDLEAVISAVNEGKIFAYISKPWDPTALKVAILQAVEHHHVLEELRDREEIFQQLADNIDDVFWMMSIDGKDIYVSPAYENIWGRPIEDLLEQPESWLEFVHPEDRDKASLDMKNSGGVFGRFGEEYRIIRPDGSIRWINDQAFQINNQAGKLYRYAGIARDVTERKCAEARFQALLEAAPDALVVVNQAGEIQLVNSQTEKLFGYVRDELMGQQVEMLMPEHHRVSHIGHRKHFISDPYPRAMGSELELYAIRKDGSTFPTEISLGTLESDKDTLTMAAIRNITDRKEAEQKIARLNRVHALLSGINSTIVRTRERQTLFEEACHLATKKGDFLMAWIGLYNPEISSVHITAKAGSYDGYLDGDCISTDEHMPNYCTLTKEAMEKAAPVICNDVSTDQRMKAWKDRALERGFRSIVILPLVVDGSPIGLLALYANETEFFTEDEMELLTEVSGDISYSVQNIQQQEKLDYLAYYDSLTGLPNRNLFIEHLSYIMNTAEQTNKNVAVIIFDIKHFRHINSAYGKHVGDELLKEVAMHLQLLMNDSAKIARISGDYFAMILPKEEGQAAALAHWFESTVAPEMFKPIVIEQHEIHVDITAGIAMFPESGEDADTLYHNAEAALKKAKALNEKYLFYQSGMMETIVESVLLRNKLRDALEQEQFILYYQPKIDISSNTIAGFEALIRWNDPETGLVPPNKFISLLEESGLIVDVGAWAMRSAMEDVRQWQNQGLEPVRIAINVSALQLQQKNFVDVVADIVNQYGGEDCLLDLEVTESLLMQDFEENVRKLAAIRNMGVSISIDDFGTGYSSLSYLTKLPVNALKIDRSFITSMDDVPESMTIVSSIITLAHSLALKVIAEGVETEEQAKLLKLLKCEQIQGYLYSKPLPPKDIPEFMKNFSM